MNNTTGRVTTKNTGRRIRLSATAEAFLAQLADDLITGYRELWQLPPSLMSLWTFGEQCGYQAAKAEDRAQLERAESAADRFYQVAFARKHKHLPPAQEQWVQDTAEAVEQFRDDRRAA